MNNFNALDFNVYRSEEVIHVSFFWRSVYVHVHVHVSATILIILLNLWGLQC